MTVTPFGIRPDERTVAIVDGGHFFACHQSLGFKADFKPMMAHLEENTRLAAIVYHALLPEDPSVHHAARPLIDWLGYNGARVRLKPLIDMGDSTGRTRYRGTVVPDMAVDITLFAPRVDHILLFAGDGDLHYAVEQAQNHCRVTVISTKSSGELTVNDDLRRLADKFIDVSTLEGHFTAGKSQVRDNPGAEGTGGRLRLPSRSVPRG